MTELWRLGRRRAENPAGKNRRRASCSGAARSALLFLFGLIALSAAPRLFAFGTETKRLGGEDKPTLIIMLDAVPLSVALQAIEESAGSPEGPLFAGLSGPTPMVSSFPSTTTVALAGMFVPLGMKAPPGYEAKFFDRERGRVRGGGPISYKRIKTQWPQFFDWRTTSVWRKSIGFLRPVKASHREIENGIEAFLQSSADYFFVDVASTDGAAHLRGPHSVVPMLRTLDLQLQRARLRKDFYTVIFSDHGIAGGEPLLNVRRAVKKGLRLAGLHPGKKLRRSSDVALVPFGLLSSLVAFTEPGRELEVAEIVGGVFGVELCAAPTVGGARVFGASGSAEIRRVEEGSAPANLVYEPISGDPLGYATWAGKPLTTEQWLSATIEHHFPDALHRVLRAFDTVANPASVVCSLGDGFMYGPWTTEWPGRLTVGRLRYTHGALEREASLGLLLSDHPALGEERPRAFDEALLAVVPRGFRARD